MVQGELALENQLIKQLNSVGYESVDVKDEASLLANLKLQIEKRKNTTLSETEFNKIINILDKGTVFERAKTLRGEQHIERDNGDNFYFYFLDKESWNTNTFQVTNQITKEGAYKNRYDVTLLINGLPLVQIELKRRGVEMAEAFHQIKRYKKNSFASGVGLFQYIQLFIISNGVNSKYFANNKNLNVKQTFFWANEDNKKITALNVFADSFLVPNHLHKMLSKYIVLAESDKTLMVLRPYQYYATEKIIDKVKNSTENGYIWHTTGSGKTLTSFKASQLLMDMPEVYKIVFVVDRRDLDFQTTKEFNNFSDGSVDGTDNTKALVKQFGNDTKLIVTTIQKLNNAIGSSRYVDNMKHLNDKRIVFIFDECHRTQFGETHKRIKKFFLNSQMFGFTGTPIFADNAVKNQLGKRTTKELFGNCLHKYVITDAIKDENVLRFSIEYVGRYKHKKTSSLNFVDIDVEGIDTRELLESDDRLDKITDYIIQNHKRKTHNEGNTNTTDFTGMFCVSGVEVLKRYYELFRNKKEKGKHDLKIATIFSYAANEEIEQDDYVTFDDQMEVIDEGNEDAIYSRDSLEEYIGDYNKMFGSNYTTKDSQSFYNYYNDIARRVKNREIDILLVVNMFLTGFDSKPLNTLYVDKNLKHHGLIQAYSRTNRILNKKKSHGNIVSFRNLKKATDEAIALFSNKDANEVILMKPYEDYIEQFNEALVALLEISPSIESVNDLESEVDEETFVKAFRALMRLKNSLSCYSDFSFEDLDISEQDFEDYKSKYLDIYDKVKNENSTEKDSILNDVDFEIELVHKDEVTVFYILSILKQMVKIDNATFAKKRKAITDLIAGDIKLRSKRELIERFIDENLLHLDEGEDIEEAFDSYWGEQKLKAFNLLCKEEALNENKIEIIIEEYLFSSQITDLNQKVDDSLLNREPLFKRKKTVKRVIEKIMSFIETFTEGLAA